MVKVGISDRMPRTPLHYREFLIVSVGSANVRHITDVFRREFNAKPSTICVVSSPSDREKLLRVGFPSGDIVCTNYPFRTNAEEADRLADLYLPEIVRVFKRVWDSNHPRLVIVSYAAFGGTCGLVPKLVRRILSDFEECRVLTLGILPAASFSTPRQRRNLFVPRQLNQIAMEFRERLVNFVYSDIGKFGDVKPGALAAEWLARMILVQGMSTTNPLNFPCFYKLEDEGEATFLGVPFFVDTQVTGTDAREVVEGVAGSLGALLKQALEGCEFDIPGQCETCFYVVMPNNPVPGFDPQSWKEALAQAIVTRNSKLKEKIASCPVEVAFRPGSKATVVGYVRGLRITVRGENV
jgi:hypothetical protein